MQLCGCLPVRNGARDEDKQSNTKQPVKQYSLKRVVNVNSRYSQNDVSARRSVAYANESENEQQKFLELNKEKRRSIHELQFNQIILHGSKRAKSSPDVNQFMSANTSHETTTCDDTDNPDNSRHKRAAVRRRKRSKSPRKQMPSEILDAIKFELVEPIGLDDNQLKDIPYENIKTTSQPFRISLSPHSARRRRSSPFNRAGDVVHNASNNMLPYRTQPAVVCVAQVKSTKIINISRTTENCAH
ncbi:unnamed protein product [Rotaria sp. Silwood2]|nr:unnamed protein product [Rotaria sp. Silwood2]